VTRIQGWLRRDSSLTTGRGKRFFSSPEYLDLLGPHKITDSTDTRDIFQKAKQPGHEANRSPPSSVEVKNELNKMFRLLIRSQVPPRDNCTSKLQQFNCILEAQLLGLVLEDVC